MLASSWRAPAAGSRLFSRSSCASVSWIWSANVFSSTRATRRVPGIGAMSSPRVRIHASAVCAGVARSPRRSRGPRRRARGCGGSSPREAGVGLAPVVVGEVVDGADLSREQAVAERRVGHEADPELAQQRQDVRFHVAGPQRVLGLKRGDRLHGVCAADGLGGCLGEAEVQHLAVGDQVRDGLRGLLDRGVRVDAVLVEQVDVVGAQALERPFDRDLDARMTAVDDAGAAPVVGHESELRGDLDLVASALDGLPDDLLAQERAVDLGGVDVRDAELEGAVDGADRLRVVQGPFAGVGAGHGHRAEADAGDLKGPEVCVLHVCQQSADATRVGVPAERGTGRVSQPPVPGSRLVVVETKKEIQEFLTSRRAAITPEQAGVPSYGARRVPGLRREEVAVLAGVSVPYYTRLERGDLAGASDSVLEALARALQLDDAERAHLFDLARAAQPLGRPPRRRPAKHRIRPSVQQLLDALTGAAAHVGNERLDILGANPLGRALFPDMFAGHERPNAARFVFLDPRARDFYVDWDRIARDVVAPLRSAAGRNPYDRDLSDLVGELSTRSQEFRQHWAKHDVRFHISGVKNFHHIQVGNLELNYERLEVVFDTGLTIFTYTADPGTRSAEALGLLGSLAATTAGERPAPAR